MQQGLNTPAAQNGVQNYGGDEVAEVFYPDKQDSTTDLDLFGITTAFSEDGDYLMASGSRGA